MQHNCYSRLPTGTSDDHWVAVRIVRPAPLPYDSSPYPSIQACLPWQLFVGWRDVQQSTPELRTVIDDEFFATATATAASPSYAFCSVTDTVVFVVGPNNSAGLPNLRVKWGDDPAALMIVSGAVRGPDGRRVSSLSPEIAGWGSIPLTLDGRGSPPSTAKWRFKGPWTAIEVHSSIRERDPGVKQRIEHFVASRVPPARFWQYGGGYGGTDPRVLQLQSQAAIAFQFAVRAVLRDSGWAAAVAERGVYIKLMGFEANNPLHDDHSGRGAHFHVTTRYPKELKAKNTTPHLYLANDGKLDAQLTRTRGWSLEVFGIFVRDDGALDIGPLVEVKHASSDTYLHVRKTQQEDRHAVVAWDQPNSDGNRWMLLHGQHNGRKLCSTRSWRYLHVRLMKQTIGDEVVQWGNPEDDGSLWQWHSAGLKSCRSGNYLALANPITNRKPTLQSDQSDRWDMVHAGGASTYRLDVSYTVRIDSATPDGARASILRNGQHWLSVATSDDTAAGLLTVVEGNDRAQVYPYNPLTGA